MCTLSGALVSPWTGLLGGHCAVQSAVLDGLIDQKDRNRNTCCPSLVLVIGPCGPAGLWPNCSRNRKPGDGGSQLFFDFKSEIKNNPHPHPKQTLFVTLGRSPVSDLSFLIIKLGKQHVLHLTGLAGKQDEAAAWKEFENHQSLIQP